MIVNELFLPSNLFVYLSAISYLESSQYWEGPNRQDTLSASVRVRAWKQSSFPKPDFHSSGIPIGSKCNLSNGKVT